MTVQLSDFINLYTLPCGRALYAARQVQAIARDLNLPLIEVPAEVFFDVANDAHNLEFSYRTAKVQPQYGPLATKLDNELDRGLGAFDRAIGNYEDLANSADTEPELTDAYNLLAREAFPRGVTHITLMSFPEEWEEVGKLLPRLQGNGDLAGAVARLSLQPFVAKLAKTHTAFGAELKKTPKVDGPTFDQIRAARAAIQTRARQLVAVVLGTFPLDDDDSVTKRGLLLEPLIAQQRAIAATYKSRRTATDVNPETGEVTELVE